MAITGSGQVSLNDIQTEYGGSNPIGLSEYYSKGNAPGSGEIQLATDFYGTSNIGTAWTTTTAISSSRDRRGTRGSGSNSDFLLMGGYDTAYRNYTDEWNGSSWAAQSGMPGSYLTGWYDGCAFGRSSNDAGSGAGYRYNYSAQSKEYNGSSWSMAGTMNTGRQSACGAGESTNAAFIGGGYNGSLITSTEEYNGSSWATANNMIYTTYVSNAMGSLNDGMQVGGQTAGSDSQSCSEYNGTNWSAGGNLTMTAGYLCVSFGETVATAHAVGSSGNDDAHDAYNGSSWSTATGMSVGHHAGGGGGGDASGFVASGLTGGAATLTNTCEEWT